MKFKDVKLRSGDHKGSLEFEDKALRWSFLRSSRDLKFKDKLVEVTYLFRQPTDFSTLHSLFFHALTHKPLQRINSNYLLLSEENQKSRDSEKSVKPLKR